MSEIMRALAVVVPLLMLNSCDQIGQSEQVFAVQVSMSSSAHFSDWSVAIRNDSQSVVENCTFVVNSLGGGYLRLNPHSFQPGELAEFHRAEFTNSRQNTSAVVDDMLIQCEAPRIVEVHRPRTEGDQ